ncbi:MAG TPA: DUF481 domain-containing protein [Planctomycetes bacterium]|nr:DUF481 domain-containing protein [Planctomycetota bacterium]HIL51423.1 DUF481 domain-containing protein [Planctomycetota bacterium]
MFVQESCGFPGLLGRGEPKRALSCLLAGGKPHRQRPPQVHIYPCLLFTPMLALVLLTLVPGSAITGAAVATPLLTLPMTIEAEEEQGWEGSLAAGGIVLSGNNKSRSGNASADFKWCRDLDRVTLGALWSYRDDDSIVTQRKVYGSAKYDRFWSESSFAYGQASGDSDKESGLDLRLTLGAGLGRQLLDSETWKLSAELGLSGVSEEFQNSGTSEYLSGRAAYGADYTPGESWTFTQQGEIFPSLEDSEDFYARVETRARLSISDSMFAQIQWVIDFNNTPDTGKQRSDHLLGLTVGWSF